MRCIIIRSNTISYASISIRLPKIISYEAYISTIYISYTCPKIILMYYTYIQCNNMNTGHETVQQQQHSEQNGMSDTMHKNVQPKKPLSH